jgi:tol-pal system protein YbgF
MNKFVIFISTLVTINCFSYADFDRLDSLEKEIRKLTNKVEILEHQVNMLKQNTVATNPENQGSDTSIASEKVISPVNQVNAKISSDKQMYDLALSKLKDKKYDTAKNEFADLLKKHPKSPILDKVMFWYAESFFGQKDFQNAALNYLQCYQKFPKGQKAQDALIKLALSLSELKRKTEVCKIISKLEGEFPNRSASIRKIAKDLKAKHSCK